ncbi:MAG: hypothetical protein J1F61_03840 [Clostridiales bacterium]|nr:hypothetical protein [Clostridiales bacterium]
MLSKKYLIISILLTLSLVFIAGCVKGLPYEIPALSQQGEGGDEGSVTVYVLTRYELTEIVVDYQSYDSWTALLEGEFDGRNSERAKAHWKGNYVTSIGNLRPNDPSQIILYLNGVYSNNFVANCDYLAGYTLAFVERGADIQTLL